MTRDDGEKGMARAQAMEREGRDPGIGGRQDSLYP